MPFRAVIIVVMWVSSSGAAGALARLATIQGLRAIAALSVLFFHIRLIGVGYFGVDIFFVISGFIVCYVADRQPDHFLAKRLIRIVPLYWVATAAMIGVAITLPALLQSTEVTATAAVKSLLFIPYERATGMVQPILFLGWTLNYEMFFYVLFGACLAVWPKHAPIACASMLTGLSLLGQVAHLDLPWSFWCNPRLLEFVAGMVAFYLYSRKLAVLKAVPVVLALGVAVASVGLMALQTTSGSKLYDVAVCGPLSFVLVLSALSLEGRMRVAPVVILIGDASYSLYLLHPYVVRAVEEALVPLTTYSVKAIAASVVTIIVSIVVAVICYWTLEKPTNSWLRRHLTRTVARTA
ncbi:MAG: Exopolysaccharide production protein ExoZ [Enhydrobacter sp.]|jgi:peptidoglycan/LPS O-acetylase OafA/YrhL|nr:MAG: Exopolysaccharide production protein ExoZ [Enhydrobacter sp.]